jgi:hypothetical protein
MTPPRPFPFRTGYSMPHEVLAETGGRICTGFVARMDAGSNDRQ